jgi:hypothetical protein
MRRATFFLALVPFLLLTGVVFAYTTQIPSVDWWVMSGGGAPVVSGSGNVALNGSLGQTAVGPSTSASGDYGLDAGYWSAQGPPGQELICLPVVLRGS